MKIIFDTNIILDVLLNREQFVKQSALLVSAVENNHIEGYLCATTITTLDYLISKNSSRDRARTEIGKLLSLFTIAEVNSRVLEMAVHSKFKNFEDAVQYYSAECSSTNGLVTRNSKDFKSAELPVYSPDELWKIISIHQIKHPQ